MERARAFIIITTKQVRCPTGETGRKGMEMETITKKQFYAIDKDYRGTYIDYDGKHPDWKGKRTAFLPGHGTTLFIEGISFEIV